MNYQLRLYKTNNFWVYIFILILLQSTNLKAQEPLCEKVIIQYVNFGILSFIGVKCSDFEDAFGDQIKSVTIQKHKEVKKLVKLLNNLKIDNKRKFVDVRLKIKLFYSDYTESICVDWFSVLREEHFYKMTPSLMQFLEKQKAKNELNQEPAK